MTLEKKIFGLVLVVATILLFTNCDYNVENYDSTPPSPPKNVQTFVGDEMVEISWENNRERDVAGYNVYYSNSYYGTYNLIGNTSGTFFIDYDAVNGELYYYAVAAYDYDGNESELSYDKVYGVARPEGLNQAVFNANQFADAAGYDFSKYLVLSYNDWETDFFFDIEEGVSYINVWDDADIQDMGYTENLYDITYAPLAGWKEKETQEQNIKYVEAKEGHTYIIWTYDNHFAKIRISLITPERIVFDWAYQLLEGEPQLKTNRGTREKVGKFRILKR